MVKKQATELGKEALNKGAELIAEGKKELEKKRSQNVVLTQ